MSTESLPHLTPHRWPGRANRKARAFTVEIARLREAGHTFEGIREALAAAGIVVSKSTVQREVSLLAPRLPREAATVYARLKSAPQQLPNHQGPPAMTAPHRGKDIAEAFVRSHVSNPLFSEEDLT